MSPSNRSHSSGTRTTPSQRGHLPWKVFARELFGSMNNDDIFGRSAQLAYYFFFALFPGFIFLSALLGMFAGPGSTLRTNLFLSLARVVPPQAMGLVMQTFTATTHGGGKITFGMATALWSATVGMAAVADTLNGVHQVKESRPYWKVRLVALGLTIATVVLLLCAAGAFFAANAMLELTAGTIEWPLLVGIKTGQWVVAFACVAAIFAMTYFWAPDVKDRTWHWITPGAGLGIVLWAIATVGLRIYLHYSHSFSATYGSLGAVMILLTWFYIGGFALLTGAEVNAIIENRAAQKGDPDATAKGEKSPNAA